MKARLENEYNVECRLEGSPWNAVQWARKKEAPEELSSLDPPDLTLPSGCSLARDQEGQWVVLLPAAYLISILHDRNEAFEFSDSPFDS
jgi:peptide subunit release factor RF-3